MPKMRSRKTLQNPKERFTEAVVLRYERSQSRRRAVTFDSRGRKRSLYGYKHMRTSLPELEKALGINIRNLIKERIKKNRKASIIDLGCGEGVALQQLRKLFPDRAKLELAGVALNYNPEWKDKSIRWAVAPFYRLPEKFKGKKFDIAFSHFGLEHSANLERDSKAVWQILKDNGVLITTMPVRIEDPVLDHEYIERSPEDYLKQMPGFKLLKAERIKGSTPYEDSWVLHLIKVPMKKKT